MGETSSAWSPKRAAFFLNIFTTEPIQLFTQKCPPSTSLRSVKRWVKLIFKQISISALSSLELWPVSLTKILVVLLVFCICQTSAASNKLQCPDLCTCFSADSISPSSGALMSVDCSGLGFSQVVFKYMLTSNSSIGITDDNITLNLDDQLKINKTDQANNTLIIQGQPFDSFNSNHNQLDTTSFLSNEVQVFDMSNNKLQCLTAEMFPQLGSLDYLNASHNSIYHIENTTFTGMVSLKLLDLSHNNINTSVWDSLHILSRLSQLLLNNNHMQFQANSTLVLSFNHLTTLDISNNPLMELHLDFFQHLPFMHSLNLANCSLQELSAHLFKNMKHLEKLNLNSNSIRIMSQPLFQETSLKWLSISSMPNLTTLSHVTFHGLSQLEYLNLSNNPNFHWIQPDLFTPLKELKILDLSHSGIKYLSEITFVNNVNLMKVFLNNNPFHCSCVNAWLAKEVHEDHSKFVNISLLECINFEDKTKSSVAKADFQCYEVKVHNMTSRVSVPLGSRMLLECKYDSDEAAVIKWTTPSGAVYYHHHFYTNASQHMLSPQDVQPESEFHIGHYWHDSSSYHSELSSKSNRVMILSDGSLYIDYMMRSDPGPYTCQVSNQFYNQTTSIKIYIACKLSGEVKIFAIVVGLLCALAFFTLNVIYVIISWTARRLVNKRRREIIRQMLENLNAYKTTQITRIHENYTHQLTRVRNQYHIQRDKLHRNYTSQVARVKRGCSNQVEKVRDNYNSKLHHLREYSTNQIIQIRERANNQIVRIRDYGSSQLDKLRETYKLQQQHVLKLLDTMNLDNCRHVVETECMRAESMMYDIDLLGEEDRTDSPLSEYTTAASSPATSLEEKSDVGLSSTMEVDLGNNRDYSTSSSDQDIIIEMQTRVDLEPTLSLNIADRWQYDPELEERHEYSMKVLSQSESGNERCLLELESETSVLPEQDIEGMLKAVKQKHDDNESQWEGSYVTPDSSPVKYCPISQTFNYKLKHLAGKESQEKIHDNSETDI
uniref:Ig-like domain-containing protein n=1 Tax=Biomphalaria glabrata TaxID=6526 RepID=A0A2C9KMI5_BIOGL